jgi:transposase
MKQIRSFVGMDVHKTTISISVAEDGRSGPVRFLGVIPNTPEAVHKMVKQLARHGELDFCYEASGCGYGIHRQLTGLGHKCTVAAPSMIPRKPGERIKTDRRDSEKLAILHRSGDLTPVWVPSWLEADPALHSEAVYIEADRFFHQKILLAIGRRTIHSDPLCKPKVSGEIQFINELCDVAT